MQSAARQYMELKKASENGIDTSSRMILLPRGGTYVNTACGPIQFGMPPETIKDSMNMGLTLPNYFVLPKERFNLQMGINVAEFEFPAYYNFFFRRKRINIVCTKQVEPLIRTIFQETLLGPREIEIPSEFSEEVPADCYPDLAKELSNFRVNPFDRSELKVDSVLEFTLFDDEGVATLPEGVTIVDDDDQFIVRENGEEVARPSSYVLLSSPIDEGKKEHLLTTENYFCPPNFGVTMLGNSDGFDKNGTTTGFVLWMNRRGIMVDPPPHSSKHLRRHGINPRLIRGIILTHCHADHDAGTFQKILEEGKVTVMTTEVILNSFIRKYSAIAGLEQDFLRKLFSFRPAVVGQKMAVYGGEIQFFYSLHSIPCVGFSAYCNGKSMVYSADTFNEPNGIRAFYEKGLMSEGRMNKLINFPWHHDVILHEAGVPPIHTPLTTLEALSDDIKRRLYIVHKPSKDVPTSGGLKSALVGPENTIVISNQSGSNFKSLEVLDLVGSIDIFAEFAVSRGIELITAAKHCNFQPGDILIQEGTTGCEMFIMAMGMVEVSIGGKVVKTLTVGDHFGEMSLVTNEPRTATIRAVTDVETICFSKSEFLWIVRNTNAIERLQNLGAMQRSQSWQAISANSVLCRLTSAQKTYLQSILQKREVKTGEVIWQQDSKATEAVLVGSGKFVFARAQDLQPFSRGALVGDMAALLNDTPLTNTLICIKSGQLYYVNQPDLLKFFDDNPGVRVFFMNRRFVE